MEPTKNQVRAVLPIGKYRVTKIDGNNISIFLGGTTTMTVTLVNIDMYDIRVGDLLSFYTEVLFKERQNATQ